MKTVVIILFFAGLGLHLNILNDSGPGEKNQPGKKTLLDFKTPPGFPTPNYRFSNNQLTKEGFELGRKLFYDGRLSQDGNFPCSSCHQQFAAFATYEHRLSHGFNNQFSFRNAPGLFNIAWQKELHWDGGINHLEVQPLAPITDPHEMAEKLDVIIVKLKKDSSYRKMFRAAFGDESINSQKILKALAQFVGSMVSCNSKYDRMKRGELAFNQYEQAGYLVFQQKCASCHREPLFTDLSYRNTGLAVDTTLNDYGRMRITGKKEDSLRFRVPSLRNVYLTNPYGHDGRFSTLTAILNHYISGTPKYAGVDSLVRNGIPLTDAEKFSIISFLGTLTDTSFVNDKRFSDPQ